MISLLLWRQRLNRLDSQLNAEPDATLAWRWRGEVKVLRFLLRRYGEGRQLFPLQKRSAPWISWLALDAPEKARLSPGDLVRRLRNIAGINRKARLEREKPGSFWAAFFHPTGDVWLGIEKRGIEAAATESERKRKIAERKYQRRLNSRK